MTTRIPLLLALTALAAACSRSPEMDAQMKADLDAASTATVELAPRGPSTGVVSAIESKNVVQPTVAPVRKTVAPARTPRPETPTVVAELSSNDLTTPGTAQLLRTKLHLAEITAKSSAPRLLSQSLPTGFGRKVLLENSALGLRASWDCAQYGGGSSTLSRGPASHCHAARRRPACSKLDPARTRA